MIIYKITNLINGKMYIGQTIGDISKRFIGHANHKSRSGIRGAIKKYGRENFTIEVIDVANSQDELNAKEKYWVEYLDTISPNGYNLMEGGGNSGSRSAETRNKMKKANSGRKHWLGKKHENATKEKISSSNRNCGPKGKINKYKGVYECKGGWRAIIYIKRKQIYLGKFENEVDAAIAYNSAVDKYYDGAGYKNQV